MLKKYKKKGDSKKIKQKKIISNTKVKNSHFSKFDNKILR
jgi:hypothetical protein